MVSMKLFSAVFAAIVVFAVVEGSTAAFVQAQTATTTAKPTQTITQIVESNKNFTVLAKLLNKASVQPNVTLAEVLNGSGNYTLFAPDDAAFAKVNTSSLAELQNNTTALSTVMKYHVVPTTLLSSAFTGSGTVTTLNGLPLAYSVSGTTIEVGNATVTKANVNATNGVIHVIDSVLEPPATGVATASPTASGGFLGLPGFEAVYAVAGLLAVAYLLMRRRN